MGVCSIQDLIFRISDTFNYSGCAVVLIYYLLYFLWFEWVKWCAVGFVNSPVSGLTPVLYTNQLEAFAQIFSSSQNVLVCFTGF